ncbi:3-oxoacid CoA-transferase subunit B [Acidiphilium sp. AL]|uniref:3-oxoacid CoA-transferase subunit B n=1 Tax=Acidiphilium sp. AL TaxID=2871704 RepID=UPI0021CB14A6|nr:3-oxoacid CoA-transferase subunit B [Acidiphilium sp. AL]MCU4161893.1 3-oxoacid CoA-transferase subunit B [Acidiphilium sp. AL]
MSETRIKGWSRTEMAARAAADIPEGWAVNLGIGLPTLIANYVPAEREVMFHSENGVLGVGPAPDAGAEDIWLINAGKQPITLRPGASIVGQADSFGIIRGGHLDLCVLGGYEVAANGDLANWSTGKPGEAPAVGGAMDLGAGAKRVWVLMEHTTRDGRPKLVERCAYPLTALGSVTRIYTDLAVIDVTEVGFRLVECAPGVALDQIQARTGTPLVCE